MKSTMLKCVLSTISWSSEPFERVARGADCEEVEGGSLSKDQLYGPLFALKVTDTLEDPSHRKSDEVRFHVSTDEFNVARGPIGQRSRGVSSMAEDSIIGSINYSRTQRDAISRESFKCKAFCLYLPVLSKRRTMQRSMNTSEPETRPSMSERGARASVAKPKARASMVSRVASLERFECDSLSSGIIFDCLEDDKESWSMYFDLPSELIRSSNVDTDSPVKAAFVFDSNRHNGALKKSLSHLVMKKQCEVPKNDVKLAASASSSHLSLPGSSEYITPPVPTAEEEFNDYLEAQST